MPIRSMASTENTPDPSPSSPTGTSEGAGGTAVAQRPAPVKPTPKQLPPYRVLLHNDDEIEMPHVVISLVELTPLDTARSTIVTLEAHNTGVALILVTHKERAELYQEQLRSKGLKVTIEPAEA
ncbi:MAG: ATP-dependent Clp protease adaptor ClpS [Phycisphaerales bacterium]